MTSSEICVIMYYEFKLKTSASEAVRNINKAYGSNTVLKV